MSQIVTFRNKQTTTIRSCKNPRSPYSEASCVSRLRGELIPFYSDETDRENCFNESRIVSLGLKSLILGGGLNFAEEQAGLPALRQGVESIGFWLLEWEECTYLSARRAMKVYIDGKYLEEQDAKVSVFDHGLLYGDGVFEGIRAYNGRVFKLKEHVDRLWYSAKAILLNIPISKEEMGKAVVNTCRENNIRDGYIRLVVTRGVGGLGLNPNKCKQPSIIVIADKIQLYPKEMYERGLDIITVPTIRNLHSAVNPAIKSLNYLNNILAKIEANNSGCEEAIMLNEQGYVSECTGDNIFLVKGNQLLTPPLSAGALYGITRGVAMELGKEMGMEVAEPNLTRYDVFNADECFLTGTGAELIPVVKVDGRVIGEGKPGPRTLEMVKRYSALTKSSGEPIYA